MFEREFRPQLKLKAKTAIRTREKHCQIGPRQQKLGQERWKDPNFKLQLNNQFDMLRLRAQAALHFPCGLSPAVLTVKAVVHLTVYWLQLFLSLEEKQWCLALYLRSTARTNIDPLKLLTIVTAGSRRSIAADFPMVAFAVFHRAKNSERSAWFYHSRGEA